MILLLITILLAYSCSKLSYRLSPRHDDFSKEFISLKQEFIYESKGKITEKDFEGLTMGLIDYPKGSTVVGTCWPMMYFTEIDISREDWKAHPTRVSGTRSRNSLWKKELVYHEFAHCLMSRNHSERTISSGFVGTMERIAFDIGWWTPKGRLKDGCPASLMNPNMVGPSCFGRHYDYYIAELFTEFKTHRYQNLFSSGLDQRKRRCGAPEVINKTNKWIRKDQQTLKRAYKNCINIYHSCLKTFVKTEELAYQAMCGDNYVD